MNRTLKATTAAIALSLVTLTGCARNIDIAATGAEPVPGARNLYRLCDQGTLIYFTSLDMTDDEYEWFYPDGCIQDHTGRWVFRPTPPDYAVPHTVPNGDSTNDANDQ